MSRESVHLSKHESVPSVRSVAKTTVPCQKERLKKSMSENSRIFFEKPAIVMARMTS
jgi:hypothetical protein